MACSAAPLQHFLENMLDLEAVAAGTVDCCWLLFAARVIESKFQGSAFFTDATFMQPMCSCVTVFQGMGSAILAGQGVVDV